MSYEMMRRKDTKEVVRIYSKDESNSARRWHCALHSIGDGWVSCSFNPSELEPIPTKHTIDLWFNFYKGEFSGAYVSRSSADSWATGSGMRSCVKRTIEFYEGEGL